MPTFKIDGYTFLPGEEPARGPIVGIAPQRWSKFPVLGAASPGTILTYLGSESQEWDYVSRASATTATKLLAVYNAKQEVTFITPQNTDGFKVIMTRLKVPHETPIEGSKYLCEFTLMSREAVAGGIVDEEDDLATIVRKTADETVNNSDALQDDDELFFAAGASEIWVVDFYLTVAVKSASDFKFDVDAPAGSSVKHWTHGLHAQGVNKLGLLSRGTGLGVGLSDTNIIAGVHVTAMVVMGGTAGNIQLRWAQNAAVAEDTIVYENSYLVAFKQ